MSIFDKLFGSTPPTTTAPVGDPTQKQQTTTPTPAHTNTQQQTPTDPNIQQQQTTQISSQTKTESVSPLDVHSKIWETDPTKTTSPKSVSEVFSGFDPQKALEAAAKVDFTKAVTPETAAKIAAGGQEAVAAFIESLNKVAQTVYANSAITTTKIVEKALTEAQGVYDTRLQAEVKRITSRDALVATNPLLSNPAVKPVVEALQETLLTKNPHATSAEINTQINDFFSALGESFGKKPTQGSSAGDSKGKPETDWTAFFNEGN